jgi:hypothetical protein
MNIEAAALGYFKPNAGSILHTAAYMISVLKQLKSRYVGQWWRAGVLNVHVRIDFARCYTRPDRMVTSIRPDLMSEACRYGVLEFSSNFYKHAYLLSICIAFSVQLLRCVIAEARSHPRDEVLLFS